MARHEWLADTVTPSEALRGRCCRWRDELAVTPAWELAGYDTPKNHDVGHKVRTEICARVGPAVYAVAWTQSVERSTAGRAWWGVPDQQPVTQRDSSDLKICSWVLLKYASNAACNS